MARALIDIRHSGESALWIARDAGDVTARDELVARHLPLACSLADRYLGRGVPREDLQQVAAMGLVRAVDRFDHTRSVAFSSFAVPTILGELRRYFRDHGWVVKVPRDLKILGTRVREIAEMLTQQEGAPPSAQRVADEVGADLDDVIFALDGLESCYRPAEVPTWLPLPHDDGSSEDAVLAHALMQRLDDDRDRLIVYLRFWGDLSQQEIAERLDVSQMHVSRLLQAILRQMFEAAGGDLAH